MNKAQVRALARKLGTEANDALFRLADILLIVHNNGFYHGWGWRAWGDYVESEVGISTAASYELMQIARWANRYGLTKAQRNRLAPLGRCKVAALTKLARKDNVDDWFDYATENTVRKLKAMAKGIHDANAPQTVAVWLHAQHRRDYQDAMNIARDKLGDVIQGELLGDICAFYIRNKKLRTRK
jgi:hypothetical protein